ncbi:putative TIM-barrel fold metal-dependent hydrolase [Motilibacter rhizosphaerae]|uniref:Putative TIM-barrel fold metal-dependent hydrolase n=1 Tax=Motilibacter rhizosphaerae TaxID=598652 RepID=A0A4V2F557_9ACTN|nr:amidohydrolase family protein [Motilibacter rhizosphaerae]RZS91659.1 putative TIM-barrel fold metal-dependent hydrolase [Motilibacter rhizosphaerae]
MPQRDVIDAHHHLWHPQDPGQEWLAEPGLERIRAPFGMQEFRSASTNGVGGVPVAGSVVVQSVATTEETAALLATAADDDLLAAVVGWVDLTGDVPAQLAALQSGPGGDALRGLRHLVQSEEDPRWLLRPDVLRGLRAVEDAGLAYDVLVRVHQLASAEELARTLPGLRLVLDHAGKPDLAGGELAGWRAGISRLAEHEGVVVKLSGLVTEADHAHWSPGDIAPAWDTLLEAFGPSRIAFGSDWPYCLLAATWERWAAVVAELVDPLSPTEQDQVLRATATTAYALDR